MEKTKIAIIGAGAIGRAIGGLLKDADVSFWDTDAAKVPGIQPLKRVVSGAGIILLCIPANATREAVGVIISSLLPSAIVVSVSKGLERVNGHFMDEVLLNALPKRQRFGLLFGPMLADELARGKGGAATIGAVDRAVYDEFARHVAQGELILEYSNDVRGVAALGVLKNVYAIALGVAAGLGYESDMRGWLIKQAINEMRIVLPLLGGNAETVFTNAGIGDLVATGLSPCSRNWKAGHELAASGMCYVESEGLLALPALIARVGRSLETLPLLYAVADIAVHRADAARALDKAIKSSL